MSYSLGVDIGSTYTAAALWRDGSVQSAPLGNRANAVPSVLFLREDGTLLVGEAAARRAVVEPDRQARDFKRRMGDEVPIMLGGGRSMPAAELTGHLLRWVVDTVSEREGEAPGHLVLTHPAEWGEYRRSLLVEAAATAGLSDVGLLPEPVAAAAWYAAQERVEPGALIGVYDLGGGTFDASVVRKTDTGFEVFGEPGGDETIGGLNFDHAILRYVAAAAGVDLSTLDDTNPAVASALAQFRDAIVDAKEALSADVEAAIPILLPGVARHVTLSRTQLESLIRPQVLSTVQLFAQIVARAGADPAGLRSVLLIGGSSRIPLVTELLRSELSARVAVDAHPKYAVSLGAAITSAPHVQPLPGPGPGLGPVSGPVSGPALPVPPVGPGPVTGRMPVTYPQPRPPVVPTPPVPGPPPVPVPGWPVPPPPVPVLPRPVGRATVPVAAPAVVQSVNLAVTGLTRPTDVTVMTPRRPPVPRPRVTDTDEPIVVRTGTEGSGYWGSAAFTALIAVLVLVAVVAAVVVIAVLRNGSGHSGGNGAVGGSQASGAAGPSLAALQATGDMVTDPPGADAMRGVAALPNGDLVAVGQSEDLHPRAWLRHGTGWRYTAPPDPGHAGVFDVAVDGSGRVVAVGWAQDGGGPRHPAVWTSTGGDAWKAVALPPDLRADGVGDVTAVVPVAGGGFLATAVDTKADKDGDMAVFRSPDGTQWQRLKATGLDGPGKQQIQRLTAGPGGTYLAVGSALNGARLGPALWSSTDGQQWQPAPSRPSGSGTLWAAARQSNGSLVICGAIGSVDSPAAGCWVQRGTDWTALSVTGTPTVLYVYGLVTTAAGLVGVGVGRAGDTIDAAGWQLHLPAG